MSEIHDITTLEELQAFANAWVKKLQPGDLITLSGELGAGKTTFVKAIVEAMSGDSTGVQSPTFSILHQYPCAIPVIHIDAYRLEGLEDAMRTGIPDVLSEEGPASITFVEWPEKVPQLWGPVSAHLLFQEVGSTETQKKQRTLTIESSFPS